MSEVLPVAVWEGSFKIGNVTLRCAVLDNGMRVINAEDMHAIFDGTAEFTAEDVEAFCRWQKGLA